MIQFFSPISRISFQLKPVNTAPIKAAGRSIRAVLFSAVILAGSAGCSGGGGGGDGSSGGGRSTDTAVRIVHGAIDQPPVDLSVDAIFNQSARYGQAVSYVSVEPGAHTFFLSATNSPGTVIDNQAGNLAEDTEYSLILFGKADNGTFRVSLVPDQTLRPEKGFASVRVIHSVVGLGPLTTVGGGVTVPETGFGNVSPFTSIPSGPIQFSINDRNGNPVSTVSTTAEDRGELTLLVSGDQSLGAVFVTVINDLD